jgi:putative membrane protein
MTDRMQQLVIAAIGAAMIASATAAPQPAKLSSPDRYFLADSLSANQLEIDASTYAAKQASSDKVRQFAQQMVIEHGRIAAEMQKVNDGLVVPPAPTPQPGPNLEGRTGVEFDKAYLDLIINYDNAALGKFRTADGPQHGAPIREMSKTVLPMISRNDELAKAMRRSLGAKK